MIHSLRMRGLMEFCMKKKIAILLASCLILGAGIAFAAGYATCGSCFGSGRITCASCYGTGMYNQKTRCAACGGTGVRRCPTCGGRGQVYR